MTNDDELLLEVFDFKLRPVIVKGDVISHAQNTEKIYIFTVSIHLHFDATFSSSILSSFEFIKSLQVSADGSYF